MATKVNDDGSVTVELDHSITAMGETLSEITLRAPTFKEMRKLSIGGIMAADGDALAKAIGALGALPPSSVDQIKGADITAVTKAVLDFLQPSPTTGEPSGPTSSTS